MRSLVLVLVAVMGCDNGAVNNGQDMSGAADMAMSTDDMNVGGDGGASCDVATQTGCATGQKCVPNMTSGHCVTDGTVTEGQACMRGMMGMPDNCVAGLTCSRTGLPTGMSVCRKYCTSNSGCTTAGQKCALGGGGGG